MRRHQQSATKIANLAATHPTRYGRVRRHQQSVTKIKNLAATHPTQTVNRLKQAQTIVFLSAKLGLIAL